jgi:hypothetical protein
MMKIIPFEIEHFDRMELMERTWQRRQDRPMFARYPKLGPAYTLLTGDKPIICAGVAILGPGVGEAWALISKHLPDHPLSVYKGVKRVLEAIIDKQHLHRVQAVVKEDDQTSVRWIERLRFVREGILRQFGPDKTDYVIYGRIR